MSKIMISVQRWKEVVRVPVEAELFQVDGLELAVHKDIDAPGWLVTEPWTGRYMVIAAANREAAIEQAITRVREKGVEYWRELIAKYLAEDQGKQQAQPKEPKGALAQLEAIPGHWYVLKSPFQPGDSYHAGLMPHSVTGWNGRPDYRADGATLAEAIQNLLDKFAKEEADL